MFASTQPVKAGIVRAEAGRIDVWPIRYNTISTSPQNTYAVMPTLSGLEAGVYHYVSRDHCLERRCFLEDGAAADLARALPADSFLVGLSSIRLGRRGHGTRPMPLPCAARTLTPRSR